MTAETKAHRGIGAPICTDRDCWCNDPAQNAEHPAHGVNRSSKERACPYCKRPEEADGSIYHAYPCAGLDRVDINRLQYDALVAAARSAVETPASLVDRLAAIVQPWVGVQATLIPPSVVALVPIVNELRGTVKATERHCSDCGMLFGHAPSCAAEKTDEYTTQPEVMNPPQSAAEGCEAGNLTRANVMGLDQVQRGAEARPADASPVPTNAGRSGVQGPGDEVKDSRPAPPRSAVPLSEEECTCMMPWPDPCRKHPWVRGGVSETAP